MWSREDISIDEARERQYIAIDLKSYYASAECVSRSLDPLATNLVVADPSRTDKTICLAVSPPLKELGVPSRPRLFEVIQKVDKLNEERLSKAVLKGKASIKEGTPFFMGSSFDANVLKNDISLKLSYIVAPPRMSFYEELSARIYAIYLKYISPDDILVYSIDEVFMDVSQYLDIYGMDAHALAMTMIRDVLYTTGITATAGIGTNMYLAKIAMDIVAKKTAPDKDGVRIASLDEISYRKLLWSHEPLTDFWRIGRGISRKLYKMGLYTMGDIARCSLGREDEYYNEDLLYKAFGINAELLIDHAWGFEPCRMVDIKKYIPKTNSLSTGQVLPKPYTYEKARNIVMEMTDTLILNLLKKGLCTKRVGLGIGFENMASRQGKVIFNEGISHYVKPETSGAHGFKDLSGYTVGEKEIMDSVLGIFEKKVDPDLLIRHIYVVACDVRPQAEIEKENGFRQLLLFTDYQGPDKDNVDMENAGKKEKEREREARLKDAVLKIRERFGKNYLLKGINFKEDSREMERNEMIGGHRA